MSEYKRVVLAPEFEEVKRELENFKHSHERNYELFKEMNSKISSLENRLYDLEMQVFVIKEKA